MGGQKNGGFVWTPTKRRGPIAAEFSTPGPAAIGLPSTFGASVTVKSRSPAFTISSRHELKPTGVSPGPGQYNINGLSYKAGKDEPHAPSMHIRPKDPKGFITPAPGDYCPEKSQKVLDQAPKFSFGIKADNGLPTDIPGPGTYNEAVVDAYKSAKSPAFSIGQRTNIPSDHTRKPGPGAHCPEKYNPDDGPKWTMRPKTELPSDKTPKPSPNAYCPEKYHPDEGPKWTIRPKTELPSDKTPKPSPNAYCPEKYHPDDGPKWTMRPKTELPSDKTPKPSPNAYCPEKYHPDEGPKWTIRPKTELPSDKTPKPSPNAYCPEKCMPDDGPKWTMSPRTELPTDKTPKPSPNAYSPDEAAMARRNPEFSFGIKHSQYLGQLRDQ